MMNRSDIEKMMVWLRRKFPEDAAEVTLYNLFVGAFYEHFKRVDDQVSLRIQCDLEAFETHESVPLYVSQFARRVCAKFLLQQQPTSQGDLTCLMSETHW